MRTRLELLLLISPFVASNWTFNFVVVMIVGPSFNNISWRTYIVFAALNAAILPVVYFFFPETGGRSLEGERLSIQPQQNERKETNAN